MGVPSFFRKLIKKHKIISYNIDKQVKSLYIDANCLFHPQCFKELEKNITQTNQTILLQKMSKRIIEYIEYIIRFINPTNLVYIAVDGVAPVAKINQQRKRRFTSANEYKHRIYKKYNIPYNDSWSNIVITPGTDFMFALHQNIYNHFKKNHKNEKYSVLYSSYLTHGEGEHKILQYVKEHEKNDNSAIIIYGLDADLIFLSMASQKKNIYLLREDDQLLKSDHQLDDNEINNGVNEVLCYVNIDFAKESINNEFIELLNNSSNLKYYNENNELFDSIQSASCNISNEKELSNLNNRSQKYEILDFINDYIFICYFLGNDFLPHIPSIDINIDGIDTLMLTYIEVFESLNKKLISFDTNDNVIIDNDFLLEFIAILASREEDFFKRLLPEYIRRYKYRKCIEIDPAKREIWKIENLKYIDSSYDPIRFGVDNADDWKFRYYSHYFKTIEHQSNIINDICHNYLEGLLWVAKYYFEKCTSWRWQYKYTHAPFLSDILLYLKTHNIMIDCKLIKSKPINMYTQLVSVLPPTFCKILPKELRFLNNSIESPIIDMFPLTFQLDALYKTQLYKCIPIIPFLDIERVEMAVNSISINISNRSKIEKKNDFKLC